MSGVPALKQEREGREGTQGQLRPAFPQTGAFGCKVAFPAGGLSPGPLDLFQPTAFDLAQPEPKAMASAAGGPTRARPCLEQVGLC